MERGGRGRRHTLAPVGRRKHWGWGDEDRQPGVEQVRDAAPTIAERIGVEVTSVEQPLALERVQLPAPRVRAPAPLAALCSDTLRDRVTHAHGCSYADIVDGMRGRFPFAPDLVARPRSESDIEALMEWCAADGIALVPFGGGTSVVGGVTPDVGDGYAGVVSLDCEALAGVRELDTTSQAALIGAGTTGPRLERELGEHGLTLRFFPQSFEFSTLGGWIATRAGGHFATLLTHAEDLVESVRMITPAGVWQSRRLPASGAGPSPDRLVAGSEGTLGVITEAWMRVRPRPAERASAAVAFDGFLQGAECVRELAQSGLHPSNCRLLDVGEAAMTMAGDGRRALLVLAFESAELPVGESMKAALAICARHGGAAEERGGATGAAESWRAAFLQAPYLRDLLTMAGVLAETFETAVTWERFPDLHERVCAAVRDAMRESCGEEGRVHCRFTHVYPDGPAPYFTVLGPAVRGGEVEQWQAVKRAASEQVLACGGTITHHHAVGRAHRPWYERERPDVFAAAYAGARGAVDPHSIMNPGVLAPPAR